jgi:hypothetical protein
MRRFVKATRNLEICKSLAVCAYVLGDCRRIKKRTTIFRKRNVHRIASICYTVKSERSVYKHVLVCDRCRTFSGYEVNSCRAQIAPTAEGRRLSRTDGSMIAYDGPGLETVRLILPTRSLRHDP